MQSFDPIGVTEPGGDSFHVWRVALDGYRHSGKDRLGGEEEGLFPLQRSSLNALNIAF